MVKLIPEMTAIEIDRFRDRIKIVDSGCHEYQGALNEVLYGVVCIPRNGRKTTYKAHRIAYKLHYGIDPADLFVCHTCDNPGCCNPAHLWLGTNKENIHDSIAKKRNSPPPPMGGWNRIPLSDEALRLLGTISDLKMAELFGSTKHKYQNERRRLGIPSCASVTGNDGKFRKGGKTKYGNNT